MLNPTTLAALATTVGAHWLTPTGLPLQLVVLTSPAYRIPPAARGLWHLAGSRVAYDTGVRLDITLAPADAIVVATQAGGLPIPRPVPCAILTGAAPPDAMRLAPDGNEGFEDLIADLLATPAPDEPQPATWGEGARDALGDGPQAMNALKVATILAVARDRLTPAVRIDDIRLAAVLVTSLARTLMPI